MTVLTSRFHTHVAFYVEPDAECTFCGDALSFPCIHYNHGRNVFMCAKCSSASEGLLLDMHKMKRMAHWKPGLAEEQDCKERERENARVQAFLQRYPEWGNSPSPGIELLVTAETASPEGFATWSAKEMKSRAPAKPR